MNDPVLEDITTPVLRVWPGVVIVVVQAAMIVTQFPFGENQVLHGWAILLVWWFFLSRIPVKQRWLGLGAFVGVGIIPRLLMHRSLNYVIFMYVVPTVMSAVVLALLFARRLPWSKQRWVGLAVGAIAFVAWTMVRVDGVSGSVRPELAYRWQQTEEEVYLTRSSQDAERFRRKVLVAEADEFGSVGVGKGPSLNLKPSSADWPSFRGVHRNSRVTKDQLGNVDVGKWTSPPVELWRRRVGPAWSSFAVVDQFAFTQEQRGGDEAIVCYEVDSGAEVWHYTYADRFEQVLAGVGPRGTPTIANGRLFATGANGKVTCLDAATGKLIWQNDVSSDTSSEGATWGFSSSPLVVGSGEANDDLVIVHAGGSQDDGVIAYHANDGRIAWMNGNGAGYSSPHLVEIGGVRQVVVFSSNGLESFFLATGESLWQFEWSVEGLHESRITQPLVLQDEVDDSVNAARRHGVGLLIGSESEMIRLQVDRNADQWQVDEVWRSLHLKPDFNDFVVHQGYIYGFDGSLLCCVELETGKRVWRKRGYGKGQMLLVPDQDCLVVLTETGEVAVVDAAPESCKERFRFQAIEGKTWNHPVIVRGRLLVRNAIEAACFDVSR